MRLGSKVEHGTRLVLGQQTCHQCRVANIALHKHMAWVVFERR